MTTNDIRDGVFSIIRSAVGQEMIALSSATTAADVPGWDSLKHVKIILGVEDHFAIHLSAHEIDGLRNIGDFIALIAAKTGPTP